MNKALPDLKENTPSPDKKEKTVHLHFEGDFTLRDGKVFVSKLQTSELPITLWTDLFRAINDVLKKIYKPCISTIKKQLYSFRKTSTKR